MIAWIPATPLTAGTRRYGIAGTERLDIARPAAEGPGAIRRTCPNPHRVRATAAVRVGTMCQQMPDPVVSEAELRRYLRHASVLLGIVEPPSPPVDQRVLMLRRARHWLRAALAGVDQLLRIADAIPETVDDPLTPGVAVATITHEP